LFGGGGGSPSASTNSHSQRFWRKSFADMEITHLLTWQSLIGHSNKVLLLWHSFIGCNNKVLLTWHSFIGSTNKDSHPLMHPKQG